MGKAALTSHMEGARHQRRVRDSAKSVSITRSFASVEETSQVAPMTFTNDSVMEGTGEGRAIQSLSDLWTLSKKVADAEISWALKCVSSHFSGSSNTGVNDLFKRMFSDSQIAANYSMSESKFRYVTTYYFYLKTVQRTEITDPLKVFDSFSVFVETISYLRIFHLVAVFYITAHLVRY